MFDKIRQIKTRIICLPIILGSTYLILSCAPAPTRGKVTVPVEERPARIEWVSATSGPPGKAAALEIATSKPAPYTASKLDQPLRLIVEVNALPVEKLEKPVLVTKKEEVGPTEPRLFFSPGKTALTQVLGVDFFMLPKGKSRIIVTTSKKAECELRRKNSLTLLLHIGEATIPQELTRYIDSSYFEGAVNRITPMAEAAERRVDLEIRLKEMVPYCLVQTEREVRLDFGKTSVKPPAKKMTPSGLRKAPKKPEKLP